MFLRLLTVFLTLLFLMIPMSHSAYDEGDGVSARADCAFYDDFFYYLYNPY